MSGYTVFFLCDELFKRLWYTAHLFRHFPDFRLVWQADYSCCREIDINIHRFESAFSDLTISMRWISLLTVRGLLLVCATYHSLNMLQKNSEQHFHSFTGREIGGFQYGDKGNVKGRINYLCQAIHPNLLSSKAENIF